MKSQDLTHADTQARLVANLTPSQLKRKREADRRNQSLRRTRLAQEADSLKTQVRQLSQSNLAIEAKIARLREFIVCSTTLACDATR